MSPFINTPFWSSLAPATREQLRPLLQPLDWAAGQVILTQQDSSSGLFLLEAGSVFLYREAGQKRQGLTLLKPGDSFGGESFITGKRSPYAARAVLPGRALLLEASYLAIYVRDYPDFMQGFLSLLMGRLQSLTLLVHDLAFRDVASRLAAVLLMLSSNYGEAVAAGVRVPNLVSQAELAEMVGTAREVISRTLTSFEAAGILHKSRRELLIYDLAALQGLAEAEAK